MELRHVKIFVLAAEYQNFSKVAEFAFISQSSVSKYIQILEDELGGALFARDGRHTELSEFGRAFLPHAISILEKEEEAKAVLQHFKQGYRHENLRIGIEDSLLVAPPEVFFIRLARAISTVHTTEPGIQFDIQYYSCSELEMMMREGRIDLALRLLSDAQAANEDDALNRVCLSLDRNYLTVSAETDVSGGYREVMKRVDTYMFDGQHMPRNVTYTMVNQYGISSGIKVYRDWNELLLNIILGNGRMAAIMPGNMRHIALACGLNMLPMEDFQLKSGLYGVYRKGNESCAELFLSHLKKRFQENINLPPTDPP